MSLPSQTERPIRPARVVLPKEEPFSLQTSDGQTLEALGRLPSQARRIVILCHPHPLHGGTMHNAIVVALAEALGAFGDDVGSLRFNFRGVEKSTGRYCEGEGEKFDVFGAVDGLRNLFPHAFLSVAGYSFGSWVGLRAAWEHEEVERVALIAPAARIFPYMEQEGECRRSLPTEMVVGDSDAFVSLDAARDIARHLGARLHVMPGADHFFVGQRRQVAALLLPFLVPEIEAP